MFVFYSLTGGIACGKSTISNYLRKDLGVQIVDADECAKSCQVPGTWTLKRIFSRWPEVQNPDGSLNRAKLGEIVFANKSEKTKLETLMFPAIVYTIVVELVKAWWRGGVVVLDHPLLFESPLFRWITRGVIVVWIPEETQKERLIARNGFTEEHAMQRIRSQLPLKYKIARAQYLIDNRGDFVLSTKKQIDDMYESLKKDARKAWWQRLVVGTCVMVAGYLLLRKRFL
eukprot:PhF_6_TR40775/c0_g1_i1/m.61513/K00859/coaE; dephospho-CoA kinase